MKQWLTRLGLWIARFGYWPSDELIQRATALACAQDQPGVSGEYKRHQVLARLMKEYPGVSGRTIALSIELGLLR